MQRSYEGGLHREIEAYDLEAPLAEVWPKLLEVMAESGYRLRQPTPVEDRTLESDWREAGQHGRERMLVRILRVSPKKLKLRITKQFESVDADGGTQRQLESWDTSRNNADSLAWMVMEHAEPARTAAIEERLRRRNDRAGWFGC